MSPDRLRRLIRPPRRTVRFRLTALYGGLFLISGAGLLTVIYFAFRSYSASNLVVNEGTKTLTIAVGHALAYTAAHAAAVRDSGLGAAKFVQGTPVSRVPVYRVPVLTVIRTQHAADLHQLLVESSIALVVMALVGVGLGWLVAGRVLRPIRTMTAAARELSSRNLHERLAITGPRDEMRELADTFDGFLARLESSFDAQRRFVHNASHELRTPLTRQRTLLEVALADPEVTAQELRSSCERVLATGEEQERLIDGLLTLARSEGGVEQTAPVDLAQLTAAALGERHSDFRVRGLQLTTTIAVAMMNGDAHLVERLIANVLDNAIEHNVANGTVDVATATTEGRAVLTVRNSGVKVEEAELDALVAPLEHRGTARVASRRHPGLGLSIIRAVATAHDAELTMKPIPEGGLEVVVRF